LYRRQFRLQIDYSKSFRAQSRNLLKLRIIPFSNQPERGRGEVLQLLFQDNPFLPVAGRWLDIVESDGSSNPPSNLLERGRGEVLAFPLRESLP
jgi:hypothetical protein